MTGKPQLLSKGQEDHVIAILRKKLLTWVLTGFALLAGFTGLSLFGIMKRTQDKAEELISKQFEEPQIRAIVRDVAAERSSTLMNEQIEPEVARFITEIEEQLLELNSLVDRTQSLETKSRDSEQAIQKIFLDLQSQLNAVNTQIVAAEKANDQLTSTAEFMLLAIKAIGNDAAAWDTLADIGTSPNHKFFKEARSIAYGIQYQFTGPQYPPFALLNDDIAKQVKSMSIEGCEKLLNAIPDENHAHLVFLIWERPDLTKYEKLSFSAYVLDNTHSLTARAMAGKHFAEESGRWFGRLFKEEWLEWWSSNATSIAKSSEENDELNKRLQGTSHQGAPSPEP